MAPGVLVSVLSRGLEVQVPAHLAAALKSLATAAGAAKAALPLAFNLALATLGRLDILYNE